MNNHITFNLLSNKRTCNQATTVPNKAQCREASPTLSCVFTNMSSEKTPCFRAVAFGVLYALMFLHSQLWILNIMTIVLLLVSPNLYQTYVNVACDFIGFMQTALFVKVQGGKVIVTGDLPKRWENKLVLTNHPTQIEHVSVFLLANCYFHSEGLTGMVKSSIRSIPIMGWIYQAAATIFLERDLEKDELYIEEMNTYHVKYFRTSQVFMAPEGTSMAPCTKAKSDEYARKFNLPFYEHVLHPRTAGVTRIIQTRRKLGSLEGVYDATFYYPNAEATTVADFFKGYRVPEVHIHVTNYDINKVPEDDEGIKKWVQDVFANKEKQLASAKKLKRFVSDGIVPTRPYMSAMLNVLVVVAILIPMAGSVLLWYSSFARWLAFVHYVFYFLVSSRRLGASGMDTIQCKYSQWLHGWSIASPLDKKAM